MMKPYFATPITREGVQCASQLSFECKEEHYKNHNRPRKAQRINRERKAKGLKVMTDAQRAQGY